MKEKCEHKWVFLETKRIYDHQGYNDNFVRIDRFYCEKCLEQKDVRREGYSRATPEWY